jgi:hypothetical protein
MFRVANQASFDKVFAKALPLLGTNAEVGESKPYWKNPELWECNVLTPSPAGSIGEKVLACLVTAQALASGWHVSGSLSYESAGGFSGVFARRQGNQAHIVGLAWASFSLIET